MHNPFGDLCYLLAASGKYNKWTFGKIKHLFLPPIERGQYLMFHNDGKPVAFISYAYVSDELLEDLKSGARWMQPGQWNCGENIFISDFIAPFGNVGGILRQTQTFFRGTHGKGVRGDWYRPAKKRAGYVKT
ncbi:ACP:hemolysin acyltransferase (hemolysin-activating protein) (HlyC) [uncultured Mediterranean phage uvMED]|nr:ACP:hemolysin acyltransferase (hemolysin-activating protein) (HlyC) [uncultured Mediterranean phage uvMED]